MLEKLFARLRSRQKGDLPAPAAAPLLTPAGASVGMSTPVALKTLSGPLTPPPLPADAWAESESGIVITDSGIIILEPEQPRVATPAATMATAAATRPPTTPATGNATASETPPRSATLPPAPPAGAARRSLAPGELDWDDVLERARAQAEQAQPPRPARAKAK
jgi:hypothetical protein